MAVTVLKNISQDEINWYHETRYWMHVSDEKTMINEAERRGRAEGAQQKAEEAAIELLKEKVPVETIAKCEKLPLERVLELQKGIKGKK